jgi:hypothetical protein
MIRNSASIDDIDLPGPHDALDLIRSVHAVMIGASICLRVSGPAYANVITDWDEKAVVVITPMMTSWSAGYPSMAQRTMA